MSALRSAFNRRVFIAGGYMTNFTGKGNPNHIDFRKDPDNFLTLEKLMDKAVNGALADAKCTNVPIEGAWVGNFAGELFCNQGHLGAALAGSHESLRHVPSMRVEGACASGGLAIASAVTAIQGGLDTSLVAGVEVQTTVSARQGGTYLASASHYSSQGKIDDFTFPAMFAMRIKAYAEKYGLAETDLARISVKAYGNAKKNPIAHMHFAPELTLEAASTASDTNPQFLSNPDLKPFLKVSDCSQVSDGAAAAVIVSEEGLAKLGMKPEDAVEILSVGHATDNLYETGNLTDMVNTKVAADRAYAAAGAKPEDIQVAEVHDCFTMAEIQMYEALGFAAPGQGASIAHAGDTDITGRIPVNTGGGLIGMGHPVGATGVKQLLEVRKQMLREAGDYQVSQDLSVGLTANMGGNDKTSVVTILARR